MRIAIAVALLVILLGGAFMLGHKLGTPSRVSAGNGGNAMQVPPQSPPAVAPRPVRIGGTADAPACAGAVEVAPFPAEGDNFLSVRAAPDLHALEIDRLTPGAQAYLCEHAQDEAWLGIVYKEGGTLGDACGVSAPVSTQQAYAGACRAGWVSRQYVQPVAG